MQRISKFQDNFKSCNTCAIGVNEGNKKESKKKYLKKS